MKPAVIIKSFFKSFFIAIFIILMFVIIPPAIVMIKASIVQDNISISKLVDNKNYEKSIYIFKWNETKKILYDDHNKILKIYGYVKEKTNIEIKNKILKVTMNGYGAILKTNNDSIDVGKNCTKAKGYMGIFTSSNNFFISKDGQVNIVDSIPCSK